MKRFALTGLAMTALACAALPVRSATGVRVKRIRIAEELALRSRQPPIVELSGAELEPAVELLDRNGVLQLREQEFDSLGVDGSSVTVAVELTSGDTRAFELRNCAEPHVCGFLRDAVSTGLVSRLPEPCAMPPVCIGTCRVRCAPNAPRPALPEACARLIDPMTCDDYLACRPVPAPDGGVTRKPGCKD